MPVPEGGNTTPLHFLSESVEEAIDRLIDLYPKSGRKGGQPKSFTRLFTLDLNGTNTDELLDLGFGKEIGGTPNARTLEIGLVGKMWAMLCLLPLSKPLQLQAKKTAKSAAHLIMDYKCEEAHARLLSFLIKTTMTDYSNPKNQLRITCDDLRSFYAATHKLAIRCLVHAKVPVPRAAIIAKLDANLALPHSTPEACANRLFKEFDLVGAKHGAWDKGTAYGPMHDFEPVLQQFIDNEIASERDEDPDLEKSIDEVLKKLVPYQENPHKPYIALVVGDEQSGKKSVVGDLLRRLSSQTADNAPITFDLRYANRTKKRLPILAMSLRNHDYGSFAAYVLAFLLRANGQLDAHADLAKEARTLKQRYVKGGSLDDIMAMIAQQHQEQPVMFIFLDAQGLDRDSLQRVLQNSGLYRLLVKLWQSNRQSRYLVTTTDFDFVHTPPELKLKQKSSTVAVPNPKVDRFAWYLSVEDLRRYRQPDPALPLIHGEKQSAEEALNRFAEAQDQDLPVTGDVLLAMSALYSTGLNNNTFFEIAKSYLRDQTQLTCQDEIPGKSHVYRALIAKLDEQEVLLPITLIAATRSTEDVLTTPSLKELCRRFKSDLKQEAFEAYWDRTVAQLATISEGARTLFISRYPQVTNDTEEMGFLEERRERGQNWYMSAAVASSFMHELFDMPSHKKFGKTAFRLIATAARRRAQLKRIRRSEDSSSSDRGEIARDIQCFVALLASLPDAHSAYDGMGFGAASNRALRLSLDEVFTISDDFNAVHAMRFAVQCVLRQDIDDGYRLSMVTDQDELRLRLYLLIFFPVGKLHNWTIAQIRNQDAAEHIALPEKLPRHVTDLFDPEICLELLLTVGLAAYHSQLPEIVSWAWRMSQQIPCTKEGPQRQRHLAVRARIAGTVVDAGIASGKNLVAEGHLMQLMEWTEAQSKPLLEEIGFDPLKKNTKVSDVLPKQIKLVQARMRLAAREAELTWIACNDLNKAKKIYQHLERLEHLIARHIDQADPVVLSGRTARRYARLLSWDYPVFAEPWFKEDIPIAPASVTRKIRHVIEANVGRLNHYAGADRIGVLVDQARRHCISKDLTLALHYVEDAFRRLESSKISHGGRLDVLAVKAGVHLALAEQAMASGETPQHHLLIARLLTKTLLNVGGKLKFEVPLVVGEFLHARAKILENAHNDAPLLSNGAGKSLDRTIRQAKACGYKSAESVARQWKILAS